MKIKKEKNKGNGNEIYLVGMEVTMAIEIRNAKITGTSLGFQDHGIFTFNISLDYGVQSQSFGGYALDDYDKHRETRVGGAYGAEAIMHLLKVVGAERWEDLVGMPCRAKADFNRVYAVGNFLRENWLDLEELAKLYRKDRVKGDQNGK